MQIRPPRQYPSLSALRNLTCKLKSGAVVKERWRANLKAAQQKGQKWKAEIFANGALK
jgi:hypothetical protein